MHFPRIFSDVISAVKMFLVIRLIYSAFLFELTQNGSESRKTRAKEFDIIVDMKMLVHVSMTTARRRHAARHMNACNIYFQINHVINKSSFRNIIILIC